MAVFPNLERFVEAQAPLYGSALAEIRRGVKRTHWMWFVFPQLAGLGGDQTPSLFAIRSLDEARAYLAHPVLGCRYLECVAALQDLTGTTAEAVFGTADAMNLRASLTLFAEAGNVPLIVAAIDRWFAGQKDEATIRMIEHLRFLRIG